MCKCKEMVFGKDDADEDSGCMAGEGDCDYDSECRKASVFIYIFRIVKLMENVRV